MTTSTNTAKKATETPADAPKAEPVKVEAKVEAVEEIKATVEPVKRELEVVQPAEIDQKTGQLILTPKHRELIKEQIAPTATQAELELFFMMAYRTRLDPLMKQLYFIKYGQGEKAKVSYVTSIDGYRIIAHRTGDFAGIDAPVYDFDKAGKVSHCTVNVYRKSSDRPFSATVSFREYNTGINLWAKMPETMIAKVAEAHALRKAFPQDLSGIYTTDEMDQAGQGGHVEQRAPAPPPRPLTKQQVEEIVMLLEAKGLTKDQLKAHLLKYYHKDTFAKVTYVEAAKVIDSLSKMPDAKADPIMVATALEVSTPDQTPSTEPEPIAEQFGNPNPEIDDSIAGLADAEAALGAEPPF